MKKIGKKNRERTKKENGKERKEGEDERRK